MGTTVGREKTRDNSLLYNAKTLRIEIEFIYLFGSLAKHSNCRAELIVSLIQCRRQSTSHESYAHLIYLFTSSSREKSFFLLPLHSTLFLFFFFYTMQ